MKTRSSQPPWKERFPLARPRCCPWLVIVLPRQSADPSTSRYTQRTERTDEGARESRNKRQFFKLPSIFEEEVNDTTSWTGLVIFIRSTLHLGTSCACSSTMTMQVMVIVCESCWSCVGGIFSHPGFSYLHSNNNIRVKTCRNALVSPFREFEYSMSSPTV